MFKRIQIRNILPLHDMLSNVQLGQPCNACNKENKKTNTTTNTTTNKTTQDNAAYLLKTNRPVDYTLSTHAKSVFR
jgi:hypothetical protein